jgi:hypothetical protein
VVRHKGRGLYGYLSLDPELDGKKKPKIWVSQRSVFSPAREARDGDVFLRGVMLVLLLAGLAAVYLRTLQ